MARTEPPRLLERQSVVGILLAAGQSTRFGAGNKCLHQLPNGIAVGLQAAKNLQAALGTVICVVPEQPRELNHLFRQNGYITLINPKPAAGMAESIRLGVGYLQQNQNYQGCIITLADMPWIHPSTISQVARLLCEKGGIIAPTLKNRRGHPVGFSSRYFSKLASLQGDSGARFMINNARQDLHLFEVTDEGILQDIDTLDDLPPAR